MTIPAPRLAPLLLATLMLLSGAAHGEPDKARCQYVNVTKVPISYTGASLSITMQGVLDGTPARMLVDTGASETFLTRTGTERRGMRLWNSGEVRYGIGGVSSVYATQIKDISAGPARSTKGSLRVIGDTGHTPPYDAILGAPFLLQHDLEFALAAKEINFFRPLNCKDSFLAYWSRDAVEIPFNARAVAGENPHFTVLLNGHKLDAIIDSGASSTVVDLKAAKGAGLNMDAPGTVREGEAGGIGERRVAHWTTRVDTLSIGDETIRKTRIGVVETLGDLGIDIVLGADFLRSHRVLFAMSQEKLYISYVGGEPLGQRRKPEPWIEQEADAGNADAQFALARMYESGDGVAQDSARATAWRDQAAALGQPQANLHSGRLLLLQGQHAAAALRIRSALDQLPAERIGALWLYLARVRGNEAALGSEELANTFRRSVDGEWPVPIAHFFLEKIDAKALLKQAGDDPRHALPRTCEAAQFMAQLYLAKGDKQRAQQLQETQRSNCAALTLAAAASAGS